MLWIPDKTEADKFADLLPTFVSVSNLTLRGVGAHDDNQWPSFSLEFRAALLQLIWLPTLSRLQITYTDFPLPYLRFCKSLKNLVLPNCLHNNPLTPENALESELAELLSVPTMTNQRPGHLTTLTMGNWIALRTLLKAVEHPTSALSLVQLQSFHAQVVQEEDITEMSKIIDLAGPSLRFLSFRLSPGVPSTRIPVIQSLNGLKSLVFSIDEKQPKHASNWMCQFLEALPEQNNVETVYIDAPRLRDASKVDWARIDDLLKRERHEKALQYVGLDVDRQLEMMVALSMPKLDMDPARDQSRILFRRGPHRY